MTTAVNLEACTTFGGFTLFQRRCQTVSNAMQETVRLQVEISEAQMSELEDLIEKGGLKTKKELLNTAFTLLKWAVKERTNGNIICSVNEQMHQRKELEMPFLEQAAASARFRSKKAAAAEDDSTARNEVAQTAKAVVQGETLRT